jgi:hypothetical protein
MPARDLLRRLPLLSALLVGKGMHETGEVADAPHGLTPLIDGKPLACQHPAWRQVIN